MKQDVDAERPGRRGRLSSARRASLLAAGLLLAVLGGLTAPAATQSQDPGARSEPGSAAGRPESDSETSPPPGEARAAPDPASATGDGEGPKAVVRSQAPEITKLMPDFRVLLDSPPTHIDLEDVFGRTSVADSHGDLLYEVKYNRKPKVARATLDGSCLHLQWGQVGETEIKIRVTNPSSGRHLDNKFIVEVWRPDYWKLILTVAGGLGIFLLGMKNMSDGLQAVAGAGLRRMISAVTDNRFLAVGVGTAVTMLIQSSSITTVMVVGFVNSGFMALSQAVGVIMGANIGTTITGWILVMKIGRYGLPLLGAAAFVFLFSKRDGLRHLAMAAMGLGMVFFGLELMKNGFAIVKDLPAFEAWFARFSADTYFGVLKCAMVGCAVTFIVQSSSATLGITIGLAVTGVIPFSTAAALVLGENIGTTITAFLASLGTTVNARRAAYFHILFNLTGVLWVTAIFLPVYIHLIEWIIGMVPDPETGGVVIRDVTEGIALTHTLFNVTNMVLFLPLVRIIADLLERLVPERRHREKPHLTSLDHRILETSAIAIEQSRVEVLRMAHGCERLMVWYREIASEQAPNQKLLQKAFHREEVLDAIQDEIVAFMTHLLVGNVPLDVALEARRQLRMADEYESVSDYIVRVLKSHLKLEQSGLQIPEPHSEKLIRLHDLVSEYLETINRAFEKREPEVITKARSRGEGIIVRIRELRREFLTRMSEHRMDPQVVVAFNAQLNSYRRIHEHLLNIAEALAGEK